MGAILGVLLSFMLVTHWNGYQARGAFLRYQGGIVMIRRGNVLARLRVLYDVGECFVTLKCYTIVTFMGNGLKVVIMNLHKHIGNLCATFPFESYFFHGHAAT